MIRILLLSLVSFLAFVSLPTAGPPATGAIRGTVRYTGKVPAAQVIPTPDGTILHHQDLIVDAATKGLRDVALVLDNAPAQAKVAKAPAVLIDQRDLVFVPRVVAIQYGQTVRFDNSDLCNHSVQGISTVPANQFNRFAIPGQPIEHVFELQKRPVAIGCSLHSWMRAWVYVVPHPWFALSDAQGRFQIHGIPPGRYTLRLHHADTGLEEKRTVEVDDGKTREIEVEWTKIP